MRYTLVLACVLVASAARADDLPDFDHALHWQVEPAVRMGSVKLDGENVGLLGIGLIAGVRYGRLMLAADLSEFWVAADAGVAVDSARGATVTASGSSGTMDRVGATARVYLARGVGDMIVGDAWLAAGVGRQLFAWDVGGVLGRDDALVGIGATVGLHDDHWHPNERRWWGGMTLALYFDYAARVDGVQPIACGGPCQMPTRPASYDRSIVFDMSFPFGK